MKNFILVAMFSFFPLISHASEVGGYKELRFGMGYSDVLKVLNSKCSEVHQSGEVVIYAKKCFEIAGKKRNLEAFFYKKDKKLAQIQFDFIKDDMAIEADRSVADAVVEGVSSKYSFDREIVSEGNSIVSFNKSAVVMIFGNSWNRFISMRVPVFKLIYSDAAQSKRLAKKYNLKKPNESEY